MSTYQMLLYKNGVYTVAGLGTTPSYVEGDAAISINNSLIAIANSLSGGGGGGGGTSGYSGYSGRSGYSGYSGTNGTNGSNGTSGFSGYSGYSGVGTSGFSGYSGYSGVTAYVPSSLTVSSSAFTPVGTTSGTLGEVSADANTLGSNTLTFTNPSGSPTDGNVLVVRVKNSNTGSVAMIFAFGTSYNLGSNVPNNLAAGKYAYFGFAYNGVSSKWDWVSYTTGL